MQGFLANAQAAECLGIAPNTLERWRHQGLGPAYFDRNNRILYDPADLATWIAAQRVEPARPSPAGQEDHA